MTNFDRRSFLLAATGVLVLAACSSESDDSSGSGDGTDGAPDGTGGDATSAEAAPDSIATAADGFTLAQRFAQEVNVPGVQRLPFSLADEQTLLSDGPDVLHGEVRDAEGAVVIAAISAKKRRVTEGLAYWDFHPELTTPGIYYLVVDGGTPDGGAIQINDPSTVVIPYPGQPLPPFDTPTTANPGDVDPICTRLDGGPCPFHDITLTEALATGKPVAYLIGTPAHCQFGTCAPGLEFLIAASERLGDRMVFVHAEVYTDDTATVSTPAVEAYNMSFEPSLFLADATGTIVTRLDAAWDQSELDEALATLLA